MAKRLQRRESAPRQGTAWTGENARWYDALVGREGSEYQRQVVFPGVLRLLRLQSGERLLDLACGQGAFARLARQAGAEVTGLDASRELIAAARKQAPKGPRYVVGDATRLDALFSADAFDAIACVLAIQNIEPLEPVLAGCARVLRPGGRLALVLTHPCFRIPRQSDWGWDEGRQLAYRRVDRYLTPLKIPVQTRPGARPGLVTWTFHRPLQAYVQRLADAGLWTNALEEWPSHKLSAPGARARAENRARVEIPLFLALRAVKVGSVSSLLDPASRAALC